MVQITAITLTGKAVSVSVELSWKVDRLKQEIYNKEGIPAHAQRMIFAGRQLEDGRALQDYNIREGSQVRIVHRLTGGGPGEMVQITAMTLTGKAISVSVKLWWKVDRLKEEIYNEEGIPPDHQRLVFAGKQLEDDMTLQDYNIQQGTLIHIIVRPPRNKT
ncbi:Polyubiquitin [Rhizoctonia solani]|uniref:Polyubiquitin n=1 Tax=Rhizoctonia solani TaxID=456999 RepID=A0A0K6G2L2_9AGAM|nr:Polyubiquitin [Rhizoctonia solani]